MVRDFFAAIAGIVKMSVILCVCFQNRLGSRSPAFAAEVFVNVVVFVADQHRRYRPGKLAIGSVDSYSVFLGASGGEIIIRIVALVTVPRICLVPHPVHDARWRSGSEKLCRFWRSTKKLQMLWVQ
jgi:hypothetical protein